MTAPRAVCLLCRHRIAPVARAKASASSQPAKSLTTTARHRAHDPSHPHAPSASSSSSPETPDSRLPHTSAPAQWPTPSAAPRASRPEPRPPARSRPGPEPISNDSSARMDALFKQIVADQAALDQPRDSDPANPSLLDPRVPAESGLDVEFVNAIGRLSTMLTDGTSELDAYSYLRNEIYPLVRHKGRDFIFPHVFHSVVYRLMRRVTAAKKTQMDQPMSPLPPVAEILRVYADMGLLRPREWSDIVAALVHEIVRMSPNTEAYPSIEAYQEHLAHRDVMLQDLVESWKVLSMPKGIALESAPHDDIMDGFWFPRLDKFPLSKYAKTSRFGPGFNTLFPNYQNSDLGATCPILGLTTYTLLLDRQRSSPNARRAASRFITRVAYLITYVGVRENALRAMFKKHYPLLADYVMSKWPEVKAQLAHRHKSLDENQVHADATGAFRIPGPASARGKPSDFDGKQLGRRLAQAYGARNSGEVDRLWDTFAGKTDGPGPLPEENAARIRENLALVDSFINIFMAMKQPDKAISAWNTLKKVRVKPSPRTWNLMLDGCKKARNLNALRNIWAKLTASGEPLDTGLWTTWVSGLIECGDIEGSMGALEQMTLQWEQKRKNAIPPSIEPVNAALAGLARLKNRAASDRLLAWAGQQGIEPDIVTFNTLLRPLVREDRQQEVSKLFQAMESAGVRADAATFTICLDATMARVTSADEEQQSLMVESVFSQMQKAGLEINLQNYGKMIYLLLQSGDRAKEAIKSVLAHLWAQGFELSPHIYTMLVEHFFSRSPPDLDAVNSLLARRQKLDFDDMDRIFYDRVIKGFSLVGDTTAALNLHYRVTAAGFLVTLGSQTELLRMLLRQDRWEDAKGLVASTRRAIEFNQTSLSSDEQASCWRHSYWHIALRHNLIQHLPNPDNLAKPAE